MKNFKGRFIVEEFAQDGQPLSPREAATKYVNYCGYLVRDNVPISFQKWRPSYDDDPLVVPKAQKAMLWASMKEKFNIPEELQEKVEHWTLKKMGEQFRNHKKTLMRAFKKEGKVPNFETHPTYRGHWDTLLSYKESEKAKAVSAQNSDNASKKKISPQPRSGWLQWK